MNARQLFTAQLPQSTCQQILADIAAMEPMQMPLDASQFNDDDLYIYHPKTNQLIYSLPSSSQEVKDARHIGFRVSAGQTWAKGMTAKYLGLWRTA